MTKNDNQSRKKLTRLQRKAVIAVVETTTAKEAAAACGASESSVYKWMRDPTFKAEVDAYEKMIREAVDHQFTTKATIAQAVIGGVMTGKIRDEPDLKASIRERAAKDWLDLHIRTRDQSDLEARVTKLESERATT